MALFTVPSRETLHTEGIADYAASQPDKSVSRGSIPYLIMRAVSGVVWSVLAKLLFFDKQRLPDTADRAYLERWGTVYNFPPLGPSGSTGTLALTVTGTAGAAITNSATLTHADGTIYQIDQVGASVGGGGTADVTVSAVSTGLATNKVIGEVLTFTSPPLNVDATATLVADLENGRDDEETEHYRSRLLAHIGDPPTGGAIHDYEEWALEVPGNTTAYVWQNRRGLGTIDVAVLGSGRGSERIIEPTDTQLYLDDPDRRPGNVADVLVLETTAQSQAVTISITIDETIYSWDWTDNGTGYTVDSAVEGSSTITGSTFPASIVAGVRITVNGEEATVTSRASNTLTLSFEDDEDGDAVTWFSSTPVAGLVRASGDLVTPVRRAILALFDRLGPARDADYAATEWESGMLTDSIITAARNVRGVKKVTVTTPSVDVEPTDELNGSESVPFLIPGNVTVVKIT